MTTTYLVELTYEDADRARGVPTQQTRLMITRNGLTLNAVPGSAHLLELRGLRYELDRLFSVVEDELTDRTVSYTFVDAQKESPPRPDGPRIPSDDDVPF